MDMKFVFGLLFNRLEQIQIAAVSYAVTVIHPECLAASARMSI